MAKGNVLGRLGVAEALGKAKVDNVHLQGKTASVSVTETRNGVGRETQGKTDARRKQQYSIASNNVSIIVRNRNKKQVGRETH